MRIAIDAMGGDFAPANVVDGALIAGRHLGIGLILVGPADLIGRELERHQDAADLDLSVVNAPDVIGMSELPVESLRRKRHSSVKVAMDLVANGEASAVVTAGNTGAAVMAAHRAFGLLPGIDRPALATRIPTRRRDTLLLDSGANLECRPKHLLQFARMGVLYAKTAFNLEQPSVGLLSIGEERTKGNSLTREAYRLFQASHLNFLGNIDARELFTGDVDVIVCDGFTGNIALKVSEGLVDVVEALLQEELSSTFATKLGYLVSKRAYRRLQKRVDYSEYGGAPLLGTARLCIIGHGQSSVKAIRNAIATACRFTKGDLIGSFKKEILSPTTIKP